MPYPALLAAGVTVEGTFDPFELFAGDVDPVSDSGVAGATAILQFQVIARDEDGLIVPWSDAAGAAAVVGTFSGVGTANDTITIDGVVFTLVAAAANAHQVTIGGTATATATNFQAAVNADPDGTHVVATRAAAVVTLTALEPGVGGNSIAVSESGTGFSFAAGATALAGGSDQTESRAIGIAAQPAPIGGNVPFFIAGGFNADVVVFPATITTLAQKKAVFDRTGIQVNKLKGVSSRITYP